MWFVVVSVILAPHGLSGILTGQTYKDTDHHVIKLLAEWKQFYPLDSFEGSDVADEKMPDMVEVVVGKCGIESSWRDFNPKKEWDF